MLAQNSYISSACRNRKSLEMEQFRQFGEVLGSLKALMVFQHHIQINKRQCCFLLDAFTLAYETIADEMRSNLRFEDKHKKWTVLEQPFKELYKILREAETYIRNCFESKNWWAKAIILYQNRDSVEFHIHNLLCCIPVVIEAIETAGELSSWDDDQINKRRLVWSRKYQSEWNDPKLFRWKFGKQYVVTEEICNRIDEVWKEDRWILLDKIRQKRIPESPVSTKYGHQLMNLLLLKNEDEAGSLNGKLLPCSILLNSKDYQVRKRLGNGGEYKEIFWLGENFILRHIKGDIEPLIPELSQLLSLSHPNILQFLRGFMDDEKKECFLVTEQMSRNLSFQVKELCGPRKRIPLALPVALDIMLQIARGMEYLHSKKIYHGDLKPSNILSEVRNISSEGFTHVKVTRFGLSSVTRPSQNNSNPSEELSYIWHAPEVLTEQEESKGATDAKYTDKSDVYSYGMICFELLTGKVPFEDSHLQGEKMSRNIRVGERPLFPHHCPKYMTNLTKRCWHSDPDQRPTFSSICRILRYIKRFLMMNSDYNHPETPVVPLIDYCDIEAGFVRKFSSWMSNEPYPVSEIPFQMFAYRVLEREKCISNIKDASESGSEAASMSGDDHVTTADDPLLCITERKNPIPDNNTKRSLSLNNRIPDSKSNKFSGAQKGQSLRPPQLLRCSRSRSMQFTADNHMVLASSRIRRKSGHASDSEL